METSFYAIDMVVGFPNTQRQMILAHSENTNVQKPYCIYKNFSVKLFGSFQSSNTQSELLTNDGDGADISDTVSETELEHETLFAKAKTKI